MEAKEAVALVEGQGVRIPGEILSVITSSPRAIFFNSPQEIYEESLGGGDGNHFEVVYDVQGKGLYTEAVVNRVSNGILATVPLIWIGLSTIALSMGVVIVMTWGIRPGVAVSVACGVGLGVCVGFGVAFGV